MKSEYMYKPNIVNGLVEAYNEFPWVRTSEDAEEYELVDEIPFVYSYWDWLTGKEHHPYGLSTKLKAYINPEHIRSVEDDFFEDDSATTYEYCEITMKGGKKYYLPSFWNRVDMGDLRHENSNDKSSIQ